MNEENVEMEDEENVEIKDEECLKYQNHPTPYCKKICFVF